MLSRLNSLFLRSLYCWATFVTCRSLTVCQAFDSDALKVISAIAIILSMKFIYVDEVDLELFGRRFRTHFDELQLSAKSLIIEEVALVVGHQYGCILFWKVEFNW